MTNREKAIDIWRKLTASNEKPEDWPEEWEHIERALDAERKAGELDWQIRALEWVIKPACYAPSTVRAELTRIRAEKAKLG